MASLAILGALLVALLVAKGRFIEQWGTANRRMEAVVAADRLLSDWWQNPTKLPPRASGEVTGAEKLSWRTRVIDEKALQDLGMEIVRLEITDEKVAEKSIPLVSVDLVLIHEDQKKK